MWKLPVYVIPVQYDLLVRETFHCIAVSRQSDTACLDHFLVAWADLSQWRSVGMCSATVAGRQQDTSQGLQSWFAVSSLVLCCFSDACIVWKFMLAIFMLPFSGKPMCLPLTQHQKVVESLDLVEKFLITHVPAMQFLDQNIKGHI